MTQKICSICQRPYNGYGNNALPVNGGLCCDECDWLVVIPARLQRPAGFLGPYRSYEKHQEQMREAMKKIAEGNKE